MRQDQQRNELTKAIEEGIEKLREIYGGRS